MSHTNSLFAEAKAAKSVDLNKVSVSQLRQHAVNKAANKVCAAKGWHAMSPDSTKEQESLADSWKFLRLNLDALLMHKFGIKLSQVQRDVKIEAACSAVDKMESWQQHC